MKYRHRTTGEIINVLRHNERGDFAECTDNNGKVYGLQANLFRDYEQVIEDKTINWEQRRYEIAKAMLPAIYTDEGNAARADHSPINGFEYKTLEGCCREAIRFADTLIKELKKKESDNENNEFSR